MCGIVGLLLKNKALRPRLGELMVPMLIGMTERGPDSSGMAVFGEPVMNSHRKVSLYCGDAGFNWRHLEGALLEFLGDAQFEVKANHCIVTSKAKPDEIRAWVGRHHPSVHVLSVGRSIDLYKDVGLPSEVAARYAFKNFAGSHLVGHTRMATESAVTPQNAHPYTAGEDWPWCTTGHWLIPTAFGGCLRKKASALRAIAIPKGPVAICTGA